MEVTPALRVSSVSKSFGSNVAVSKASLALETCKIHAIVGENGAGKSTLAAMAAGLLAPDEGSVEATGRVGLVQQHFRLIDALSVLDNAMLGAEPRRSFGRIDLDAARAKLAEVQRELGAAAALSPDALAGDLGVGDRQRLEIARVLFRDARVVILDEPTAVLSPRESAALYATLRRLADAGRAIAVVTHKMDEVLDHADAVTVMRRGRVVSTRAVERSGDRDAQRRALLHDAFHDADASAVTEVRPRTADAQVLLDLEDLNLRVRAKEIVGVAGVKGNGQRELVERLAESASTAVVHDNRHRKGLVLDANVADNAVLGELAAFSKRLLLDLEAMRAEATRRVRDGGVEPPGNRFARGGALGRQSAKNRRHARARASQERARARAADARRGHRGGAADPRAHRESCGRGRGGARHQRGPRRASRALPPNRRAHAREARRRGAARRGREVGRRGEQRTARRAHDRGCTVTTRRRAVWLGLEADAWTIAAGACAAQIAFALLVWIYGESPRAMAALLFDGTWGSAYGIGQVLFKATPLLFTGLAVHVALRAGLFNVGADGQLAIASLAVGVVGSSLPQSTPAVVAIPLLAIVAACAGALWAAPAAALRSVGAHEVISTILLNRVADALVGLLLGIGLAEKGGVRTHAVVASANLSRLDRWFHAFRGSAASTAIVIALACVAVTLWILPRTRAGREAELVARNDEACRAEHIAVRWRRAEALLVSGAFAGLASLGTVLGYKGYFERGLGAGAGFTGLAVAILGRGRLAGIVFAALLFGTLAQGGLAINAYVPAEVMEAIQGVVIVAVALGDARIRAWLAERVRGLVVVRREES